MSTALPDPDSPEGLGDAAAPNPVVDANTGVEDDPRGGQRY